MAIDRTPTKSASGAKKRGKAARGAGKKGAKKRASAKKKQLKKRPKLKHVSRRSIIRGPRTAWIFFCQAKRPAVRATNPEITFGEASKILAPQWAALSAEQKEGYEESHKQDKVRFEKAKANLTVEERRVLRRVRKMKRAKKRLAPKRPYSAYMHFVINRREEIVKANPNAAFSEVGVLLGDTWRAMAPEEKAPFQTMNLEATKIYREKVAVYNAQKKAENAKNSAALAAKRPRAPVASA